MRFTSRLQLYEHNIIFLLTIFCKSGRGFVLVFRYRYIDALEVFGGSNISVSLTQEATLQEVDNLRKQILRIKGGDTVRRFVSRTAANLMMNNI